VEVRRGSRRALLRCPPADARDGVTDVNVAGGPGSVRAPAMRVTPLPGAEDGSALISLFDVSRRTRRYEHEHRLVESLQRSLLPSGCR
jgi:hypothetical protein